MDRTQTVLLAGLLLVTVGVYAPLRGAGYVYEDDHALESVTAWAIPGRGLSQAIFVAVGPDAGRQHVVSVSLHLLTGVAVAALGTVTVGQTAGLLGAGLFLLHPLTSEAVSYIAARADVLVTLFSVLAVFAAVRWADTRRLGWAGLSLAAVIGSALSKEIGLIAAPLVVLTLARLRAVPGGFTAAVSAGAGLVVGAGWEHVANWLTTAPGYGGAVFPWPTFAVMQNGALWHLLTLLVWPVGLSLDHDPIALSRLDLLWAGLFTGLIVALLAWSWRRMPLVAFALGWLCVAVLPRFVFATSEFLTESDLYPALVGPALLSGAALARWLSVSEPMPEPLGVGA